MPPSSMMPVAMLSATSLVRFFIICFPQFLPLLAISPYPLQFSGLGTRVAVAYQREVRFSTLKASHFKIHEFSKTIFTAKKMIFVVMHCGQHIGFSYFADKTFGADALLCVNHWFRATNIGRGIL